MNNTVYLDYPSPYKIEDEVGLDDEHSVAECLKFFIFGNMAEGRVSFETAETFVQFFRKRRCTRRAVLGDPVIDGKKIVNGNRKITDSWLIFCSIIIYTPWKTY